MPIHDWTRVQAGLFHHFHQGWTIEICNSLNQGVMPEGYYALVEQRVDGPEPDVIAVELKRVSPARVQTSVGTLEAPKSRRIARVASDASRYAAKANRIVVRHPLGRVVAIIEVVSPGNKDSRSSLRSFVAKTIAFLRSGVHVLVVDLFPPTPRDPGGIHQAIWEELSEDQAIPDESKPLTVVSYQAVDELTAYIEPLAVGDALPDMPLFLADESFVPVPLQATYDATWAHCPEPIRALVEG